MGEETEMQLCGLRAPFIRQAGLSTLSEGEHRIGSLGVWLPSPNLIPQAPDNNKVQVKEMGTDGSCDPCFLGI